jgi:predicted transcriptional regulator of viral defense system
LERQKNSLKVIVWRLIKAKKIIKVFRGIYILPNSKIKIEKLANEIYFPSYVSFEYALYLWRILSQMPYTMTFATILKTKSIN